MTVKTIDVSVKFIRPDIAVAHVTNELGGLGDSEGHALPAHRELRIRVFVKEKGAWRVTAFHNTMFSPAEDTAAQNTAAKNTAFLRGCIELVNQRKIDAYMECWSDQPSNNGRIVPRDGVRRVITDIITTFPDFEWRILGAVAEGDTVVVQTMQIGTHLGVAATGFNGGGLQGVPATGKRMEILTTHWFTLRDGKVAIHQAVREDLVMMRQLGLAPTPPGARIR